MQQAVTHVGQRPEFPVEPVDRYVVEYWTLTSCSSCYLRVQHYRFVYHVNSTWKEVVGRDDDDLTGAHFVNHWQVFLDGRFTGRTLDGWVERLGLDFGDDCGTIYWARDFAEAERRRRICIEVERLGREWSRLIALIEPLGSEGV